MSDAASPRVLLVVGGGIAAYKSCELVRLIRKGGGEVTCVVTEGGQQFVTPMSLAALSEQPVYTTLWDLKNEAEMGHIQLSREADLVVVCPATADLLAKMAAGIADDLATTLILATDKPVMAVPAMNVRMWEHEATQRNVAWLQQAGVQVLDPDSGAMACGEFGPGRLPEPEAIWGAIAAAIGLESELPPEEPKRPARAMAQVDEPAQSEEIVEPLEPEPEVESGGIGGLLSSLIGRKTTQRSAEEIEAELDALGMEAEEFDEGAEEEIEPVDTEEAGGLLASKGGASAAPPTDPEALNHTVATGAGEAAPEPIDGDEQPVSVSEAATEPERDPLWGQPDFDTDPEHRPLYGKHVLVTAGPTHEPIDPVRYLANRSSGRQGFAIAAAAANAGARVTLVSGPVHLDTPPGVDRIDVESAREMAEAVKDALPADAAIMVAAVADWRTKDYAGEKMKKRGSAPPALLLTENPDILTNLSANSDRPKLLVGFAAETENVLDHAKQKRKRKGADWIVANDVSGDVMGGSTNRVQIISEGNVEALEEMPKQDVARVLIERVGDALKEKADVDG